MSPLTARQTFRETVAAVAEKAKAALPTAINGRLEAATKLVLLHDVMPQADGSILVGSSSDAMKSYLLTGQSCECQDFTRGQAPDGWCQHRIAAGIHKRVGELLPPQPVVPDILEPWPDNDVEEPPPAPVPQPLPEAPASCNVYVMISGHKVQVTLRDGDEQRMLDRLQILLDRYPAPQVAPQAPPAQGQGKEWCSTHQVAMHWNEGKEGRKGWYSHRTDDGSWCKGR